MEFALRLPRDTSQMTGLMMFADAVHERGVKVEDCEVLDVEKMDDGSTIYKIRAEHVEEEWDT